LIRKLQKLRTEFSLRPSLDELQAARWNLEVAQREIKDLEIWQRELVDERSQMQTEHEYEVRGVEGDIKNRDEEIDVLKQRRDEEIDALKQQIANFKEVTRILKTLLDRGRVPNQI